MGKWMLLICEQFLGFVEWFISDMPGPLGPKIRYLYWTCRFKSIGKNVSFGVGVKIYGPKAISIGNNCWIDDYAIIIAGKNYTEGVKYHRPPNEYFQYDEGEVVIGNNVHIAPFVVLQGHGGLSIGNDLTIASGTKIYSMVSHYKDFEVRDNKNIIYKNVGSVSPEEQSRICSPVTISDNVAVGLNSIILPGSHIGINTWLGSQSLLKGKLPENVIAFGSPAKIIKDRFDE